MGQVLRVMVDRREGDYFVGRTEFDSPEVDPEVLIPAAAFDTEMPVGHFFDVHHRGRGLRPLWTTPYIPKRNLSMNNKEFISALSRASERSQKDTQALVNNLIAEVTAQLEDGNLLAVQNFGNFEVKKKLERVIVNPSTGQKMLVPPKLVINFKSSSAMRERMQKGGEE